MRVVVTGATGNVGTSVVEALAAHERVDQVVGIARRLPDESVTPGRTRYIAADVRDSDLAPVLDGADALVHLAWFFQPTRDASVTWEANVIGSTRVFTAAAAAGVGTIVVDPPEAIAEAYNTGRGSFRVRAKWNVEEGSRGTYVIVITEMPYMVQKSRLVEKLAELLNERKLPLVADIRDESAEDVRLIIEPRARTYRVGAALVERGSTAPPPRAG